METVNIPWLREEGKAFVMWAGCRFGSWLWCGCVVSLWSECLRWAKEKAQVGVSWEILRDAPDAGRDGCCWRELAIRLRGWLLTPEITTIDQKLHTCFILSWNSPSVWHHETRTVTQIRKKVGVRAGGEPDLTDPGLSFLLWVCSQTREARTAAQEAWCQPSLPAVQTEGQRASRSSSCGMRLSRGRDTNCSNRMNQDVVWAKYWELLGFLCLFLPPTHHHCFLKKRKR